ncbi:hypothetical protein, partial [Methyloglobulus sp.]|uniref:hypothetical protein n=1 Tax=Methyloglobulus sp. TaxID=2518622 RepID=UPI0032B810F0
KNSKNSFSLWEKAGMRVIKSSNYIPHPSPLPEGEGIIRGSLMLFPPISINTITKILKLSIYTNHPLFSYHGRTVKKATVYTPFFLNTS